MRLLQRGDSVRKSLNENRPLKLALTGLMIIAFIALIQTFVPSLLSGLVAVPTLMVIILVAVALIVSILFGTPTKDSPEKRKRGLEGLDMYSMIDRLVDELDADELAYLRRRLEEGEQGTDRELSHSLETLLDERSDERQTRRE
jgi:hypothetical protein